MSLHWVRDSDIRFTATTENDGFYLVQQEFYLHGLSQMGWKMRNDDQPLHWNLYLYERNPHPIRYRAAYEWPRNSQGPDDEEEITGALLMYGAWITKTYSEYGFLSADQAKRAAEQHYDG